MEGEMKSDADSDAVAQVFSDGPLAGLVVPADVMAVWPADIRPERLSTRDESGKTFYSSPSSVNNPVIPDSSVVDH